MMIKRLSIVALLTALGGCMNASEACDGYGFESGTTAYSQCLMEQDAQRRSHWQNVSKALNGMTISGQRQQYSNTGLQRFLKGQWLQNGNRMCRYSDGTVMNIGVGICPISI